LSSGFGAWMSPRANDAKGSAYQLLGEDRTPIDRLTGQANKWPTPDAGGFNDGELSQGFDQRRLQLKLKKMNGNGSGTPLAVAAQAWPTPTVGMTLGGSLTRSGARSGEELLPGAAQNWRTPSASDGEGGALDLELARRMGFSPKVKLRDDALDWLTPSCLLLPSMDMSPSGFDVSRKTSNWRPWCWLREAVSHQEIPFLVQRLNPRFCEWLMGWPVDWTDAARGLPKSEMESFRLKLQRHFACWCQLSLMGPEGLPMDDQRPKKRSSEQPQLFEVTE
jgi:hypothetical protein